MSPHPQIHRRHRLGFTLVEVVLAIGISVGLLVVAMVFYHQAANLRTQLLEKAEQVAAIRLALDRISADLQSAFVSEQQGFSGTGDSLQFTTSTVIDPRLWQSSVLGRSELPLTDLRMVSYRLVSNRDGTNEVVVGLERNEEPLVIGVRRIVPEPGPAEGVAGAAGLSVPVRVDATTNAASADQVNGAIRFVRFRYWDGTQWSEEWHQPSNPRGVEVTFSTELPPAEEASGETEAQEVFRRLICLPVVARNQGGSRS